jgi:RNA polymerase sigma-70 factor (ECF subfamily)
MISINKPSAAQVERLYQSYKAAPEGAREIQADDLFKAVYAEVRTLVRAFTREDDVDLVQDILMRVYNKLPGFDGRAQLSTWIYSTTKNACHDRGRSKGREVEQGFDELDPSQHEELQDNMKGMGASVELTNLARLMEPEDARLLYLKLDKVCDVDVAKELGCSRAAVKVRWSRLKEKVRDKVMSRGGNDE